jgi:hypothetical protein
MTIEVVLDRLFEAVFAAVAASHLGKQKRCRQKKLTEMTSSEVI